jgi:alkylhydroperoxidase/carboxymuconolactone decarboxylase family protein YurZ
MMRTAAPRRGIGAPTVNDHEETLRKLSLRDDAFVDRLLADAGGNAAASTLDARTHALVRIAALIALDAALPSYVEAIETAQRAGASSEEIVGCLVAVLPAAGVARVVAAAPKVGLALGYDVEAALEFHGGVSPPA